MLGKMSVGMFITAIGPAMVIRMASTMKVRGRSRATRTIHIMVSSTPDVQGALGDLQLVWGQEP